MNEDTSGGVGRPGTAPGTVGSETTRAWPAQGLTPSRRPAEPPTVQVSRVRTRRHRGPSRRPAPQWTAEARSVRTLRDPSAGHSRPLLSDPL
jgi:hypothetical protein